MNYWTGLEEKKKRLQNTFWVSDLYNWMESGSIHKEENTGKETHMQFWTWVLKLFQ